MSLKKMILSALMLLCFIPSALPAAQRFSRDGAVAPASFAPVAYREGYRDRGYYRGREGYRDHDNFRRPRRFCDDRRDYRRRDRRW